MENKVLVCSVPCWNKKTGSDTLAMLMEGYERSALANLYVRDGVPDSPVCDTYYRISERAVVKSVLNRRVKSGEVIVLDGEYAQKRNEDSVPLHGSSSSAKRRYSIQLIREILWILGKWKTKEMDAFLTSFAPDVIFFPMEGYIHFHRVCRYILKKTGARGIGYFWDDNFTYKQSDALDYKLFRFWQRKELKRTAKLCDSFFAITPKTKKEADAFFGVDCKLLTKPIDFTDTEFLPYSAELPLQILYTGKLIIGRYETLKLLGTALDHINRDRIKAEVTVYTTTQLSEEQLEMLSPYVHVCGAIPQDAVADVQRKADVLLFAESLEKENSRIARLSFSTKLTDYFKSGKCILAIGDKDIAPMEYLASEEAAITASSYAELVDKLEKITADPTVIGSYAKRAYDCGYRNHNKKDIQQILFDTIREDS